MHLRLWYDITIHTYATSFNQHLDQSYDLTLFIIKE